MARSKSARRSGSRPSRAKGGAPGWVVPVVGGAALLGLGYLLLRSSGASAATPLPADASVPTTPLPPGTATVDGRPATSPTGYTPPVPGPTPSRLEALVARLRASDDARKVYYFQSIPYAFGYTNDRPDGIVGPRTRALITYVATQNGVADHGVVTDQLVRFVGPTMQAWAGDPTARPTRVVPDALPADVKALVNATARRVAPDGFLLQAA